ncbi:hypothetical protein TRFO_05220 [Tritrichomonas foetus]|uniref:DUF3447 domain-containing protein n=1 Tax=Tritrichomonas foetus TaxID=1144522 RepID=A0A1J4K9F1_9EUKA|nr:hypothetical protein TRFO_05220 [Tritrichomonas foetus]|eukprot:OHT07570.1 hypothetical protein TRFO_05220 [Tritrichomonas foetus]
MEMFLELNHHIKILRDLHNMTISILVCNEEILSNKLHELNVFLEDISISNNFSLFECFLHMLVHLSLFFDPSQKYQEIHKKHQIFLNILSELISKHSMNKVFHQSTLFYIFKNNKHFLLFLLQKGIIDISLIENEINYGNDKMLYLFLYNEINKVNPRFCESFQKEIMLTKEEIMDFYKRETEDQANDNDVNIEKYLHIRKEMHSQEKLARIIRDDNMNEFVELISKNDHIDINSKIQPSFLEDNPDINNILGSGISLIEYSMAFGSINIFRYLWVNKAKTTQNSLEYSIIGGNLEIIHILEEESEFKLNRKCYNLSVEYYHNEITEYFLNNNIIENPTFTEIFSLLNQTANFELFHNYWNSTYQECMIPNKKSNQLHSYEIQMIIRNCIFNYRGITFYLFYHFFYKQSKTIDVNSLGAIYAN